MEKAKREEVKAFIDALVAAFSQDPDVLLTAMGGEVLKREDVMPRRRRGKKGRA